ncbi:Rho guanine nucleotide exchange factor 39 [Sarotherodon galilaeus]
MQPLEEARETTNRRRKKRRCGGDGGERDTEEVKMKFSSKIVYVLRINDSGGGAAISAVILSYAVLYQST